MKNAINVKAFSAAAAAKVNKSNAIGSKASWSTFDHLEVLSTVLKTNPEQITVLLGDAYNISAWQQTLAKLFEKSGHFQREATRKTVDSTLTELSALAADTAKAFRKEATVENFVAAVNAEEAVEHATAPTGQN